MCGVTCGGRASSSASTGLSPRVRSYRHFAGRQTVRRGSISACAELPERLGRPQTHRWVYLRVCGVTVYVVRLLSGLRGLSPRVRSYRRDSCTVPGVEGSISACAELPSMRGRMQRASRVYLRVCGVTFAKVVRSPTGRGLSPRVRSYLMAQHSSKATSGSISACAELPR